MTVIVGLVHDNFVVMAADSEESSGTQKRSVFKMPITQNSKGGTLIIGGAGAGIHADTVTNALFDAFDGATGKNIKTIEKHFAEIIGEHHKNHVRGWPSLMEREDNDFSLLLAMSVRHAPNKYQHLLLASEAGTLRRMITPYHAVGVGAAYAKAVLDEHLALAPTLLTATILLYVVYKVKRDTANVGKDTEIWVIENGVPHVIDQPRIADCEKLFKKYDYAKVRHFLSIFATNGFPPVDSRHDGVIAKEISYLRTEFLTTLEHIKKDW